MLRPPALALALLLAAAGGAACQQGIATGRVIDRSALVLVVGTADQPGSVGDTIDVRGEPGDTLTFFATAIDTIVGDTVGVVVEWESSDPAVVEIDPVTGFATFLSGGPFVVTATVVDLVSLRIFSESDGGEWVETEHVHLTLGPCIAWNDDGVPTDDGSAWEVEPTCAERERVDGDSAQLCVAGVDANGAMWRLAGGSGGDCFLAGAPGPAPDEAAFLRWLRELQAADRAAG